MKYLLVFTILFIFAIAESQAAIFIWNGDGDGISWADPDNWDLDDVPTIDDDVRIENIADDVTLDSGSYGAKSVYLAGTLNINAGDDLTINKSLNSGIEMIGTAKLIVNGELIILGSLNEGILADDNASITVNSMGELIIDGNGDDGIKKGVLVNNNIVIIEGKNNLLTSGLSCTTINNGSISIKEFGAGIVHFLSNNTINNSVINIENCISGISGKFTNHGIINMKKITGGDAIRLNSSSAIIKNFGNINLEDATYLITGYFGSSFTNEIGGTITSTNPSSTLTVSAINFAGDFDFINNGTIDLSGNINRVVEMAFDPIYPNCDCQFVNNGSITAVDAATGWNIDDNASFINNAGAFLTMDIDHTFVFYLKNSQIQNSGTIITNFFSSDDDHLALYVGSTFTNEPGGVIELKGGRDGISNQFSSSTATNAGSILISGMFRGINTASTNTFSNLPTGELNIFNSTLFSIAGMINNEGNIFISGGMTSVGISGPINNTGEIEISNYSGGGIVSADFLNSGTITISDSLNTPIICSGAALNSGTINIINCPGTQIRLTDATAFINSGAITITGMPAFRGIFMTDDTNFTNESTGNIQINDSSIDAIATLNSSTFINRGTIGIQNCASSGIFTSLQSTFTNENKATISISTSNRGIRSISDSVFNNNGNISIDATNETTGLNVTDNSSVNNNSLGVLTISNADVQGVYVEDFAKLNNDGTINLEDNQTAITNSSIINNGGILKVKNHAVLGIDNMNSSSLFNNNSTIEFMKLSNTKDIRIVSGSLFKNNGTIVSKL